MDVTLFTPHTGQETIINGFADSSHKFGVVATGRQFGKSLLAQNLMLYWLLSNPGNKGAWVAPIYNQCKKVFNEFIDLLIQNKEDIQEHSVKKKIIKQKISSVSSENQNSSAQIVWDNSDEE